MNYDKQSIEVQQLFCAYKECQALKNFVRINKTILFLDETWYKKECTKEL